jgi:hypothetical protein
LSSWNCGAHSPTRSICAKAGVVKNASADNTKKTENTIRDLYMEIFLEVRTDFNEEPQFMASKKHPCGQEEEFEIGLLFL